jgi:hypothetical protein
VLDDIVLTTLLWRNPSESKNPRRGSPLAAEYCDAELAIDGTDGPNDAGAVTCNSVCAGAGSFFARGMITGRSGDDGSTELRSGDLIRDGAKGGRGGRGGGSGS